MPNWDEDDLESIRLPTSQRSGAVTGFGVATIALGVLTLLLSFCGLFGLLIDQDQAPPDEHLGGLVLVGLLVIWGAMAILAGIGILLRQSWGRILGFVLCGFSSLFALLMLAGGCLATADAAGGAPEEIWILLVVVVLLAIVLLGHAGSGFAILGTRRCAAEFERRQEGRRRYWDE